MVLSTNVMRFFIAICTLVCLIVFTLNWKRKTKWWLYAGIIAMFCVLYLILVVLWAVFING